MGPTELLALGVVITIVAIWLGRRMGADDAEVRRWVDATGIDLTPESTLVVQRYLLWNRRGRRIGAFLGFISPWLYSGISGRTFDEGAWALSLMLVGYLLGALVAEVVVDRGHETSSSAVMQPRRLVDYLSVRLLTAQRALGALALAMIVPYGLLQPGSSIDLPGVGAIAPFGLGGASIAVLVELVERRIVARRQSLADITDVESRRCDPIHLDPCGRGRRPGPAHPVRRSDGRHHARRRHRRRSGRDRRRGDDRRCVPSLPRVLDRCRAPHPLSGSTRGAEPGVIVRVEPSSPVPPFEQIRMQIATMTTSGVLEVGARLPTIRQLAKDLGVAGGTVARAYRELEAAGVIVTRGRHGSFVAEPTPNASDRSINALREAADAFAVRAHQLGADPQGALELARRALHSLPVSRP